MKTINEWLQKYATTVSTQFDLRDLIMEIRREAFERCELEACRSDELFRNHEGSAVAERIAKVYREEGQK